MFNSNRQSPTKLLVKTPFPITHAVWNFFVLQIFPGFKASIGQRGPTERRLNRFEKDMAELSDGQYGWYSRHAYLPDEQRKGLTEADIGIVVVPDQSTFYLDQLSAQLQRHSLKAHSALEVLQEEEHRAVIQLFGNFENIARAGSKSASNFQRDLSATLDHFFWGNDNYSFYEDKDFSQFRRYLALQFSSVVNQEVQRLESKVNESFGLSELSSLSVSIYQAYRNILP
jgi:hypothetical protein